MLYVDQLAGTETEIEGRWVLSRPCKSCFLQRLKDAWYVLIGVADAVRFWKQ